MWTSSLKTRQVMPILQLIDQRKPESNHTGQPTILCGAGGRRSDVSTIFANRITNDPNSDISKAKVGETQTDDDPAGADITTSNKMAPTGRTAPKG